MDDTIYRQAALDAIERIFDRCEEIEAHLPEGDPDRTGYKMYPDYVTVWKYLHQLPSAQSERPNGHWVEIGDEPYDEWECDVCGFVIDGSGCVDPEEYRDVYKYCPRCGSDMRGGQE